MNENLVRWPADLARHYRNSGYWTDEVLGEWPVGHVARASATALLTPDRAIGYQELDDTAERLASGLHAMGLTAGDRVVVQLPNDVELVTLCLALFRMAVLPVFALPAHREGEIRHLVDTAGAVGYAGPAKGAGQDQWIAEHVATECPTLRYILVDGDPGPFTSLRDVTAEPVELPRPDPEDVALFLLSGGTTGRPKLIPRTHADYAYQLRETAWLCGFDADSRYLSALPVAHNFALACPGVLGVLRCGGTAVLAPAPTPDVCFPLIERAQITATSLVPALVPLWLDAAQWSPSDFSSLELLQVGGSRLEPAVAAQVSPALRCTLQQVYGMAEGLLNFTRLDDPAETVLHTQGRPLSPGDEIRVVREDGTEAGPGETGELLTRGPYTLRGYYRAPEVNRVRFTPEGYLRTGDLVRRGEAGNIEVVGRNNDVVNRAGDKVPTQEVEEHLLADELIAAAAVFALPHPELGEQTCACVVASDPGRQPTLRGARTTLHSRGIAAYKLPDRLVVLPRLPLTGVGKIDKKALAALVTEQQ